MANNSASFDEKKTFGHGIHPDDLKQYSGNLSIEVLPCPPEVNLPFTQHVGAPAKSIVKAKDVVALGDKVAEAGGFVSASISSPLNGVVGREKPVTLPNGRRVIALPIKAEGEQLEGQVLMDRIFGGEWNYADIDKLEPEDITKAIADAGIVGLGGAAFPAHVKYTVNENTKIDTVLINGAECEPALTNDSRVMFEFPRAVVTGALLAKKAAHADRVIIGIEENKPHCIKALQNAAEGTEVQIAILKTKYPQGSEKQLVFACTGRKVPVGGLPATVGTAVSNVSSTAAIAAAAMRGIPLTHKVICVTGPGITNPKNLLVPLGTPLGFIINYCGGLKPEARRILTGGPMMGFAVTNMDIPVTKGTSGITILTQKEIDKALETNCICCGRCLTVCPMNLVPTKLALAARAQNVEVANSYHIMACFECGCCAYTCPASIPLVQLIRTGKAQVIYAARQNEN